MIVPGVSYQGPARSRTGPWSPKRFMVVHCTANTAPPTDEAKYAKTRTDGVGFHFVSDPDVIIQSLDTSYGTGHVGSTVGNRFGISWEIVGHTNYSATYWRQCIDRAAPIIRAAMDAHGIPARWLTSEQANDGASRGLLTHDDCRRFFGGTDHTDPGPNFPRDYLASALNGVSNVSSPLQERAAELTVYNIHGWLGDERRDTGQLLAAAEKLITDAAREDAQTDRVEAYAAAIKAVVDELVARPNTGAPTREQVTTGIRQVALEVFADALRSAGATVTWPES